MVKVGKKIVKFRVPILILSIILLIPAVWGYVNTRINYDVLTYLPEDIETMQGQEIMTNDFGIGAFSMLMVDGMEDKEIVKLKEKVEKVDGVENVLWMIHWLIFRFHRACFRQSCMMSTTQKTEQ